jgi:hypothetical protein
MPGWAAPFSDNLDLRGFADRTIQQELPAHLLAKICWVGNDGFIFNPCEAVVGQLAALLETEGLTAGGKRPGSVAACACAEALYEGFSKVFASWYADKTLLYWQPDALDAALRDVFATSPAPDEFSCTTVLDATLFAKVKSLMVAHFHAVALDGWQFERFELAWCAWLEANAAFNWTEERLQARVQAILADGVSGPRGPDIEAALCACAAGITIARGVAFDAWMAANIAAGKVPADFSVFTPPPVKLCPGIGFKPGTAELVEALLHDRYAAYVEVSYRLRIVLALLARLRNVYPGATLHDCDDGSDVNPVRLGSTALGVQPRRAAAPAPEVEIRPAPEAPAVAAPRNGAAGRTRAKRGKADK